MNYIISNRGNEFIETDFKRRNLIIEFLFAEKDSMTQTTFASLVEAKIKRQTPPPSLDIKGGEKTENTNEIKVEITTLSSMPEKKIETLQPSSGFLSYLNPFSWGSKSASVTPISIDSTMLANNSVEQTNFVPNTNNQEEQKNEPSFPKDNHSDEGDSSSNILANNQSSGGSIQQPIQNSHQEQSNSSDSINNHKISEESTDKNNTQRNDSGDDSLDNKKK